jgi:hypothetical protein
MQYEDRNFRRTGVIVGVLFIIATVFLFVAEAIYKPDLTPPDILEKAALAQTRIGLGLLIELFCVLAIPLIAIVLFPVLRLVNPMLAVGYVAFRLFEAALFASMEIDKMLVVAMAKVAAANPTVQSDTLEVLAQALVGGQAISGTTGPIYNLVFVVGMLMLNWMLWQSSIVPRWIAIWGLVSAAVLGGIAISVFVAEVPDAVAIALIAPLALQEMVFALWLIFKGFDFSSLEHQQHQTSEIPS